MLKTCFVIIGYGIKNDPYTNQKYDLDKTFRTIIKPSLKEKGYDCFRAIDRNQTGIIDAMMLEWIYKADLVVADISTLNPNVMYELGIRHVCKPRSTIILAEQNLMKNLPFDLSHLAVHKYEHLGSVIDVEEAERMRLFLSNIIGTLEDVEEVDSPIYRFFPETLPFKLSIQKTRNISPVIEQQDSFSEILENAEKAKMDRNFNLAKHLFAMLSKRDPSNHYLKQRLALVTYQDKTPNPQTAFQEALDILKTLHPEESTDTETLGLMGAVNKRLFNLVQDEKFLKEAIRYYERGFVLSRDYYNGINLAFLLDKQSLLMKDNFEARVMHVNACVVRQKVLAICEEILNDDKREKEEKWIILTQAEAELGLGFPEKAKRILAYPESFGVSKFQLESFAAQLKELEEILLALENKFGSL